MTPSEKEALGLAIGGGAILALWALQKSGMVRQGGLGSAPPGLSMTIGTSDDPTGVHGPYPSINPANVFFVNVWGLNDDTDWVELNWQKGRGPSGLIDVSFPTNWTPQYGSLQAAANSPWPSLQYTEAGLDHWSSSAITTPNNPGTYTLLVAVNGVVRWAYPLVISGPSANGNNAAFGAGSWIQPAAGSGSPYIPPNANGPVASGAVSSPPSSSPSSYSAPSYSASTALVPMTQSADATSATSPATNGTAPSVTSALSTSGLTGMLEGTIFGLPAWLVLAAGAGAVWYLSKE